MLSGFLCVLGFCLVEKYLGWHILDEIQVWDLCLTFHSHMPKLGLRYSSHLSLREVENLVVIPRFLHGWLQVGSVCGTWDRCITSTLISLGGCPHEGTCTLGDLLCEGYRNCLFYTFVDWSWALLFPRVVSIIPCSALHCVGLFNLITLRLHSILGSQFACCIC